MITLEDIRLEKGFKTASSFADFLEITQPHYSQMVNGKRSITKGILQRLNKSFPSDNFKDLSNERLEKIGRTIDDIKKQKGFIKDADFAKAIGVSAGFYSQMKNGFSPIPFEVITKIKHLFPGDDLGDLKCARKSRAEHKSTTSIDLSPAKLASIVIETGIEYRIVKNNVHGNILFFKADADAKFASLLELMTPITHDGEIGFAMKINFEILAV